MKKIIAALTAASLLIFSLGSISCSMDSNDSKSSNTTENTDNKTDDSAGTGGNTGSETENKEVTLTINEGNKALVSVSKGSVKSDKTNYYGFSGSGYYDSLADGTVIYSIYSPVEQDAQLLIRYGYWGAKSKLRAAKVIVNGASDEEILYCNWTNGKRQTTLGTSVAIWQDTNTITVHLDEGDNQIRLTSVATDVELSAQTYNEDGSVKTPGYWFPEGAAADYANWGGAYGEEIKTCDGNLPNLDYLQITGKGLTAGNNSTVFSTATVGVDGTNGTVALEPAQDFYKKGAKVTVKAVPADGYVFDCWYGDDASNESSFEITMDSDKTVYAHFIPSSFDKATELKGLEGYATIANDDGSVTYTVTGGAGGTEITLSSLEDLESYKDVLSSNEPYVVTVNGTITTADNVSVKYTIGSNKTFISGSTQGRFKNIQLNLEGKNYIVKNIMFGEVIADDYYKGSANDALGLSGVEYAWIDHCEFQSHLTPQNNDGTPLVYADEYAAGHTSTTEIEWAKDFYDGLLDIKNGSRYITISNCYFHDHYKACLCGSSDVSENGDTAMRLTFFGNYWENINSRQPLFRYGKAHIYGSYFYSTLKIESSNYSSTGINCRAGSELYIDNNSFVNIKTPVGYYNDTTGVKTGYWTVDGNIAVYGDENRSVSANASSYVPPYSWTKYDASALAETVPVNAGVNK